MDTNQPLNRALIVNTPTTTDKAARRLTEYYTSRYGTEGAAEYASLGGYHDLGYDL